MGVFMDRIDRIDQAIIQELQKYARITITELSTRVGLSKTPCQNRIKRLEEEGYILGYVALINQKKMNASHVTYVQVTMNSTNSRALKAFNKAVRQIPEVEQCHMTAASFDYLLKVRTSDMNSYRLVLGEKIAALPYVQQTSTFVVMEDIKDMEAGVL
ncbi:proline dehydrogenase transcriptional activator [Endozoicomonas sp. (ex Bugula neritina AB1)]|nr:proline dehydrogenase transcriptional activator [Endozoicomonas sp. (ex Bugula neritina AB1)]